MRILSVLASITVIAGTLGAGSAFAQSAPDIVSGSFGSMTCADFTALSHQQQAGITRQGKEDAAPTSLTSNGGLDSASSGRRGSTLNVDGDNASALGAPLTSGQLIAACQAAPASATLQDAFSSFTSSGINANSERTLK